MAVVTNVHSFTFSSLVKVPCDWLQPCLPKSKVETNETQLPSVGESLLSSLVICKTRLIHVHTETVRMM